MPSIEMLDRRFEESPHRLQRPVGAPRAWRGAELDPARFVLKLTAETQSELRGLSEALDQAPLPLLLRRVEHFELPRLRALMARAKQALDRPPGFVVIQGLAVERLGRERATEIFWLLGQWVGQPVAQKWDGTMLYDVTDTGQRYGYGVRGSHTSVELVFHTDNAFSPSPPRYVGLLCLQPAASGGVSRFCSLYAVHDALLREYPRELDRLYRCMLWDRQAEHAPGDPPVMSAPMFRYDGERLISRANVSLVRKGYQIAGRAIEPELEDALSALEEVTAERALWLELPLARGELQYLNNVDIAHYRSAFVDSDDDSLKRHLVRTWHRDEGRPTFDG